MIASPNSIESSGQQMREHFRLVREWQSREGDVTDGSPRRMWATFLAVAMPLALAMMILLWWSALSTPAPLSNVERAEIYSEIIRHVASEAANDSNAGKIYLLAPSISNTASSIQTLVQNALPRAKLAWLKDRHDPGYRHAVENGEEFRQVMLGVIIGTGAGYVGVNVDTRYQGYEFEFRKSNEWTLDFASPIWHLDFLMSL